MDKSHLISMTCIVQGYAGEPGTPGRSGFMGYKGRTGPRGEKGDMGPPGNMVSFYGIFVNCILNVFSSCHYNIFLW